MMPLSLHEISKVIAVLESRRVCGICSAVLLVTDHLPKFYGLEFKGLERDALGFYWPLTPAGKAARIQYMKDYARTMYGVEL